MKKPVLCCRQIAEFVLLKVDTSEIIRGQGRSRLKGEGRLLHRVTEVSFCLELIFTSPANEVDLQVPRS